jgi:hypothetical protein
MDGEETELRGKVSYAKFGLANGKPYRAETDGHEVMGDSVSVFVHSTPHIYVTPWFIYADGSSRVGSNGPLLSVGEVAKKFNSGELSTSAPTGAHVTIEGLGTFESSESEWYVKPEERIREAFDILAMLKGEPGSIRNCVKNFQEYETNPNNETRERLSQAYEAVPEHLRHYCGDMDTKDQPIRAVLYGQAMEE